MENAIDALKQSAAVLVFVAALSLAIFALTKARQAAGSIMQESATEYYNSDDIKITSNRIVGIETVIPTLYSYYKEGYTVLFYKGDLNNPNDIGEGLNGDITPLTLYYSEALPDSLVKSRLLNEDDNNGKGRTTTIDVSGVSKEVDYWRAIYGFDVDDEATRGEPWIRDEASDRDFVNAFTNKGSPSYSWSRSLFASPPYDPNFYNSTDHTLTINFASLSDICFYHSSNLGRSLATANDVRFMERSGTFTMVTEKLESPGGNSTIISNEYSSTEIFEDENGTIVDESIENEEGTQKRVIQYILLTNYHIY